MDIVVTGPGEVLIRYINAAGETLLQEKLVVSGSPTVEGRRAIDLSIQTKSGPVPVAPVLVSHSNASQRVTFDGALPSRFTQQRCRQIGCPPKVAKTAVSGRVAPPMQTVATVRLHDDERFIKYIREIARGKRK
ncbi:MAG TPA: hypothetical protein VFQ34_12060 [Nitrospiraceae bacterium]|jgi:hypothetical protein|nr:hypothetical protein [Nitrospiraceae bacterium]